jgi:hypothetical protein
MPLSDRRCAVLALWVAALVAPAAAQEPALRYEAPIAVQKPGTFIELPLPADAYARSRQPELRDLRIVDARGERVPFAWLPPRAADTQAIESARDAVLYPLPARPLADGSWRAPIDVVVEGDRISVKRLAQRGRSAEPGVRSAGWLFDLGERKPTDPVPQQLRLVWSSPNEFSAAFDIATSDDLRSWRAAGVGQVLALQSSSGPLTQPNVMLPSSPGRFVRLVWADAATAPALSAARVVTTRHDTVARDAPTELVLVPKPAPANGATPGAADGAARALDVDLGGALPVVGIDLQWAAGTQVAPVRLQGRSRPDEAWHELGSAVFYRLERQGSVSHSPTVALHATLRYVRVIPDERAAALVPAQTRVRVQAQLARLVFPAQGEAPYRLQVGSADPLAGALPIGTLVPALDDERGRFGAAGLADWVEVSAVARRDEARQREAALRPWLLWAVLIAGVAGLAFMVWRLTRTAGPPP